MEAERNALSRFTALLMAERVGSTFAGAITGVQKFGVFVRLDDTLAEGLVPARTLHEPFTYEPARQALIGRFSGTALALGSRVEVALIDADVLSGQLTFRLLEHTPGAAARAAGRTGRPRGRRR
jgi:ribonuclease R